MRKAQWFHPFGRWGNWGSERSSNCPEIPPLVIGQSWALNLSGPWLMFLPTVDRIFWIEVDTASVGDWTVMCERQGSTLQWDQAPAGVHSAREWPMKTEATSVSELAPSLHGFSSMWSPGEQGGGMGGGGGERRKWHFAQQRSQAWWPCPSGGVLPKTWLQGGDFTSPASVFCGVKINLFTLHDRGIPCDNVCGKAWGLAHNRFSGKSSPSAGSFCSLPRRRSCALERVFWLSGYHVSFRE